MACESCGQRRLGVRTANVGRIRWIEAFISKRNRTVDDDGPSVSAGQVNGRHVCGGTGDGGAGNHPTYQVQNGAEPEHLSQAGFGAGKPHRRTLRHGR